MNTQLIEHLQSLAFGEPQTYRNMTVIPLVQAHESGPEYLTLSQAIALQLLTVSEITEQGSVPDLKVENRSDKPVLLLDGEELAGAKQNRVVNSTILLAAQSVTIIPVSCSERGRWDYISPVFADSGTVMSPHLRHKKMRTVSDSLRASRGHRANQSEVWADIDELHDKLGTHSRTDAMRDVYQDRARTLEELTQTFKVTPDQHGLVAIASGRVIGLEAVSRADAFGVLFPKLIRSYALEAMLAGEGKPPANPIEVGREFVYSCGLCTASQHDSVGDGIDWRYTGRSIVGSALEAEGTMVHLAMFRTDPSDQNQTMEPASRRMRRRLDN